MDYFKLYANCVCVKGAKNTIICDLHLNRFIETPPMFYEYFDSSDVKIIDFTLSKQLVYEEVRSYLDFLILNDFGFYTQNPEYFPKIDFKFETPNLINNSILDIDEKHVYDFKKAIKLLDKLGCQAIQIRIYKDTDAEFLNQLILVLEDTGISSFELMFNKLINIEIAVLSKLIEDICRIRKIFIFNNRESGVVKFSNKISDLGAIYTFTGNLPTPDKCGLISQEMFTGNIESFSEALNFNSCLNKKLSIDSKGNIKNCPSFKKHFGNVAEVQDLQTILSKKDFNFVWEINKDNVNVCKDCEYRYLCTDCRVYTINNNIYEKPIKCNYNPYSGVWS
ncbi:MAG: grasp-with-spasm system SPASM domain peptide maturase [Sphingobacteriaceae bacterium]